MKFFSVLLFFVILFSINISFVGCKPKPVTTDSTQVTYNYKNFTYVGYTLGRFDTTINTVTTSWDTMYADSILVKMDTAKDKIIFVANTNNPLKVYPQFEYDFTISSNYYRKNFVQNYYQSFYYEGDTLKSYFYRLQQGAGMSYVTEIKFSGSLKP